MGGADSGVTESTTEIILESAWFHPPSIRATSRRLNLMSDSSYRFERGVDPGTVFPASAAAAKLILELAGGKAAGDTLCQGTEPVLTQTVQLDPERLIAGAEIQGTVPMWTWIGDDAATAFSY